jgi:hypothetical protein
MLTSVLLQKNHTVVNTRLDSLKMLAESESQESAAMTLIAVVVGVCSRRVFSLH